MKDINWKQLEKNSESKEIGFEQFCFQIAFKKYVSLGHFDSWYNTPGSEFYLTLEKDSDELNLKAGNVIGWQAKFWLNNKDEDNSPLDKSHRDELVQGFNTTLQYKPNLKKWIICTPGKFSNTAPANCVDNLELEIKNIKTDIIIDYWHKDIFLAFALEDDNFYSCLFNHYFSTKFIGFDYIKTFSEKRLERLKDKFDVDLYVENEIDKHLSYITDVEKVRKKISGILSSAKRLIKHRYPFENNKNTQYKYLNNDYAENVEYLINARCKLVEDIDAVLYSSFNPSIISEMLHRNRQDTYDIITVLNQQIKSNTYISEPAENSQNFYHEKHLHESCIEFAREVQDYLFDKDDNDLDNVEYYLNLFAQQYVHVFGSAGYGKTNLACAVCKKYLEDQIPALFILGSNIKEHSSPQDQIIASLDLKNEYSFKELLFALNELGKTKYKKIPIIIDGLNESVPTVKIWKDFLSDIIYDIKPFENLLLITTLREGYTQQVFGKLSFLEVENHYKIEGFSNYNIKDVVTKYFIKYNISAKGQFNEYLFKNPLLLKMFCEANKNSSNAIVTQNSIYKSIDSYISNLVLKIADSDPLKKSNIIQSVESISKELWDNNTRAVLYPDKYVSLIKGNNDPFIGSIAHSMMDEGMFFIRNITDDNEEIQFTYDMVGGFCIAKYCLLKDKDENGIKNFMQSDEFQKLIPSDNSHPLAEDILKAMLYLIPNRCGNKPLYETAPNLPSVIYIANLDVLSQHVNDRIKLVEFFSSLPFDDANISMLCEKIYIEVVEQNDFSNVAVLYFCYFNWSNFQRDIYWNERIRTNVWKILKLLKTTTKESYLNNLTEAERYNHLLFCKLLFSSTDNEIRNLATKTAVIIAQINPYQALEILKKSVNLYDIYILERIVAILCGVTLRVKDRNFTNECCEYLQNEFLPNTETNHIVILDYIETIFEFGNFHFDYPYSTEVLFRNKNEVWNRDVEYEKNILSEKQYFDMGVDIFDYDFVKYQINDISQDESNTLSRFDVFSKLHCKIRLHGYTDELYKEIEKKLSEEQRYRRDDNMDSRENYLFKYLWTSYYEFIGYLTLNNLIEKENQLPFRINDIMIDPTFPQLPSKIQLVNDCFLPSYNENVQDWINSDKSDYLENIYCTSLIDESDEEWILLDAHITQKEDKKYPNQIAIFIDALIYSSSKALEYIESDRFYMNTNGVSNVYSGELSWRNNIEDYECQEEDENTVVIISKDYSFQSWSRIRTNLCDRFPFLDKEIALSLNLWFNPVDLSYCSEKEKVTRFIWANGSRFYFIKKSYLQKYLSDNHLQIVLHKNITKYGEFGKPNNEKTLNPSYKDIKVNKVLII
jgi:NACHT domain.